jgi:hypothetical protein
MTPVPARPQASGGGAIIIPAAAAAGSPRKMRKAAGARLLTAFQSEGSGFRGEGVSVFLHTTLVVVLLYNTNDGVIWDVMGRCY